MSRSVAFLAVMTLLAGDRAFAQDRGGFTALVDLGVGIQNDTSIEETEVGVAGINFGVGGFVTPDLAVMFRLAGTNVNYELAGGEYGQISGVAGAAVQWWLSNRFNVEAGAGFGYWHGDTDEDNTGFGLLFGAGVPIFNRGKHSLQLGVQYAPAFTKPGTVHNFGFTFGYQFQ